MEFSDVVRRRRMVREFAPDPIPEPSLMRVLESALHAPSAGFAQGIELVVLTEPEHLERFWGLVDPSMRKMRGRGAPPVIVIPIADKNAYLARYSEPDKHGLGMDVEEGWPVPYWDLDVAMAAMLMLLAAVDEGLGGWLFGIFRGENELLEWLGAPEGCRPIGALAFGYPSGGERRRGSALSRRRRPIGDVVHWGQWGRH
jgi:nitroreductase